MFAESIHVKMPHCRKSHIAAQLCLNLPFLTQSLHIYGSDYTNQTAVVQSVLSKIK